MTIARASRWLPAGLFWLAVTAVFSVFHQWLLVTVWTLCCGYIILAEERSRWAGPVFRLALVVGFLGLVRFP